MDTDYKAPAFSVGNRIRHPYYGTGTVKQVDTRGSKTFYLLDFRQKGGNGSLVWIQGDALERMATLA